MAAIISIGYLGIQQSRQSDKTNLSSLQLRNIEVLTFTENGNGIACYDNAIWDYNYIYIKCSDCTKYIGYRGIGSSSFCK